MKIHATILKHLKTGGFYYQLRPRLDWRREADMSKVFAYRPLNPKDSEVANMAFIRPIEELTDGRFDIIDETYEVTDMDDKLINLVHAMNINYRTTWRFIALFSAIIFFTLGWYMGSNT